MDARKKEKQASVGASGESSTKTPDEICDRLRRHAVLTDYKDEIDAANIAAAVLYQAIVCRARGLAPDLSKALDEI